MFVDFFTTENTEDTEKDKSNFVEVFFIL